MGLQSLASGLSGLQNVQVSIPGLAVPISLSLNPGSGGGVTGLGQTHQVGSSSCCLCIDPFILLFLLYCEYFRHFSLAKENDLSYLQLSF